MIDFLDWIGKVLDSGITWSSLVAAFVVVGNYQEKRHMRRMIYLIAEKVGVEWESSLQQNGLNYIYPKLIFYSQKALKHQKRRVTKMNNQKINYATLIPAVLGAIKLILQPFNVDLSHITDSQVNDVVNGIAALVTIVGIFLPHTKGEAQNVDTKPSIELSANK